VKVLRFLDQNTLRGCSDLFGKEIGRSGGGGLDPVRGFWKIPQKRYVLAGADPAVKRMGRIEGLLNTAPILVSYELLG